MILLVSHQLAIDCVTTLIDFLGARGACVYSSVSELHNTRSRPGRARHIHIMVRVGTNLRLQRKLLTCSQSNIGSHGLFQNKSIMLCIVVFWKLFKIPCHHYSSVSMSLSNEDRKNDCITEYIVWLCYLFSL